MTSAPLRIYKKNSRFAVAGSPQQDSPYYDRLVKLIPGEIIAIYTTGIGVIPKTDTTTLWVWPGVCLILLIVLRAITTKTTNSVASAQWWLILLSAISFLIWLYTLGGIFATLSFYKAYVGSLLVLVWTFIIPLIYKGD